MSKFESIAGQASEMASHMASKLGGSLKGASLPDKAMKWIETGAAIGAMRTGTRVATRFVRRNPAVAVAAAAVGVGLLGYALYRKQQKKKAANGHVVNGQAQRISARDRRNDTVVDEHSDIGSDA